MIGILGGMGTQAGLDFCNKLAILNRGKIDQEYPLFLLIINPTSLVDLSLLEFKLKIYQTNPQIVLVKINIILFLKVYLKGVSYLKKIDVNLLLSHAIQLIIGTKICKKKLIFQL